MKKSVYFWKVCPIIVKSGGAPVNGSPTGPKFI